MIGCCFQAISVCAGSPLFVGLPLQNFYVPWGEPFTLLRNTGVSYHGKRGADKFCISVCNQVLVTQKILFNDEFAVVKKVRRLLR